jgi:hypothetical protein
MVIVSTAAVDCRQQRFIEFGHRPSFGRHRLQGVFGFFDVGSSANNFIQTPVPGPAGWLLLVVGETRIVEQTA